MKHFIKILFLKKKLVYLIFLGTISLFSAGNTMAQESSGGFAFLDDIYYGGKFGTSISQFTNQQPHNSINQGITIGAFVGYRINEQMNVQLELSYLEEGGRLLSIENTSDLTNSSWYSIKTDNQNVILHNLDIPLLFNYTYPLGAFKVFAVAGPALGINFHSGVKHEVTVLSEISSTSTYTGEENITSKIERYNFGLTGGIGLEIPVLSKNYILIDIRYRYGLTPVYKGYSYREIPQITGDLQNNTMYFTIGFGF